MITKTIALAAARTTLCAGLLLLPAANRDATAASPAGAAWPQWRGPDRLNASSETGLLQNWPTNGPPLVWRATGIGQGIHSVSVVDGRVFTTGNRDGAEFAFALNAATGEKLWATRLDDAIEENALMRWLTQRSPTIDDDRVYAFTAKGRLVCLRVADGQKLWERSYPEVFGAEAPVWGYTDHPLVDGDRVIGAPMCNAAAIVAFNKYTGEVIWQSCLSKPIVAGYAAITRATLSGVPQYILFHGSGLAAFAVDGGEFLWDWKRPQTRIASTYTPLPFKDSVLSPNGYGGGLAVIQVVSTGDQWQVQPLAHPSLNLDAFQDSSALVNERLYLVERGAPACVEATTGTRVWRSPTTDRSFRAALTWADGHLYFRTIAGDVALLEITSSGVVEQGRFELPEFERALGVTSPVVAAGRLWLRDSNRLFCYDIRQDARTVERPAPAQVAIGLSDAELSVDPAAVRAARVGTNRAPDAVFVPTPQDIVERMLQLAAVKRTDLVVDLGSGDGRFVIAAAKRYGCKAVGYEIDARLVQRSRESIAQSNLGALATIEHQDIFTLDLSAADVVTVFLYPRLMERLRPQLEKLKPGSRIVSHQFEMPGIAPDETIVVESTEDHDQHRIFLWTTPLKPKPNL